MARKKKTSKMIESAQTRLAALKSISADLDLGNGVSVAAFESKIELVTERLSRYNTTLSLVDEQMNDYTVAENELAALHERVLLSVASRYGKDSMEYAKAGGTRKSDRKRVVRKERPAATSAA